MIRFIKEYEEKDIAADFYQVNLWGMVLPSCETSYVVSVRQARGLPVVSLFPHPASFRSHLTMGTLAFGCILPTTGRIRDFHPSDLSSVFMTVII